ncbi:hypothetical protein HK100_009688 [Physocladia obscura]|uniref:Uncharacterized protein n=1 Tax=Physocladia obscura TaxID=109957 RepID=A0AAD5X9M3_9FUNG|nr:hypothetical protein HK100_009688 [Physocladia obscura]
MDMCPKVSTECNNNANDGDDDEKHCGGSLYYTDLCTWRLRAKHHVANNGGDSLHEPDGPEAVAGASSSSTLNNFEDWDPLAGTFTMDLYLRLPLIFNTSLLNTETFCDPQSTGLWGH